MTLRILVAAVALGTASVSFAQTRSDVNEYGTNYHPQQASLFDWITSPDWQTSAVGEERGENGEWRPLEGDTTGVTDATDGVVGGGQVQSYSTTRCFGSGEASYCLR